MHWSYFCTKIVCISHTFVQKLFALVILLYQICLHWSYFCTKFVCIGHTFVHELSALVTHNICTKIVCINYTFLHEFEFKNIWKKKVFVLLTINPSNKNALVKKPYTQDHKTRKIDTSKNQNHWIMNIRAIILTPLPVCCYGFFWQCFWLAKFKFIPGLCVSYQWLVDIISCGFPPIRISNVLHLLQLASHREKKIIKILIPPILYRMCLFLCLFLCLCVVKNKNNMHFAEIKKKILIAIQSQSIAFLLWKRRHTEFIIQFIFYQLHSISCLSFSNQGGTTGPQDFSHGLEDVSIRQHEKQGERGSSIQAFMI